MIGFPMMHQETKKKKKKKKIINLIKKQK